MSLIAPVQEGKLIQQGIDETQAAADASKSKGATKSNTTKDGSKMDKDSFLQLLVAQMQYQDPMEPTSNTEYVSQYAQFSQVESLQSMSTNMDLQRASSLVGNNVYVKSTNAAGETKYTYGKVDYVTYESGKAYMYIDENRYALEDLETIVDAEYYTAYNMATDLVTSLNKLPAVGAIDLGDGETIDKIKKAYDDMSDYQKTFVAKSKVEVLDSYVAKIAELRKIDEANKSNGSDDDASKNDGNDAEKT